MDRFELDYKLSGTIIFLLIAVLVLHNPAKSYQFSIYQSTDLVFWILYSGGFILTLISLYNKRPLSGAQPEYFLLIVLFMGLLFLPLAHSYSFFGRGDALTHIGYSRTILINGEYVAQDIYPALHILTAIVQLSTKSEIYKIGMALPPLFLLIYFSGTFLLIRDIPTRLTWFAIIISTMPIYLTQNALFSPWTLGFQFLPITAYSYYKLVTTNRATRWYIITIAQFFLLLIFHPLITFVIVTVLITTYCLYTFGVKNSNTNQSTKRILLNSIAINIVLFIMYNLGNLIYLGTKAISKVFVVLGLSEPVANESSRLDQYSSVIQSYPIAARDIFEVFIFTYGNLSFVLLIFIITSVFVFSNRDQLSNEAKFSMILVVLINSVFSFLGLIGFASNLIVGMARFLRVVVAATIIFPALVFIKSVPVNAYKHSETYISAILILMLLLFCITTLGTFQSPLTRSTNPQVAQSELEGMEWFIHHQQPDTQINRIRFNPHRFEDALVGVHNNEIGDLKTVYNVSLHNFSRGSYFITTNLDKYLYPEMYPEYRDFWRYTPSDYDQRRSNSKANLIYTNDNILIYKSTMG
ncbi:hypothetical protein [Haladaptatus sp. YSMS36]|uniref:hypothetical protein n=1 Tax=Haladaptatus sp. YSMS36 TaxID=3033384 RepID=UPI0023E7DA5B|nr:hypothetical protein [Haladaptatus sp. YSMS36]